MTDWTSKTTAYAYDGDGNVNQITAPNGVATAITSDADGNASSIVVGPTASPLAKWVYRRTANEQLSAVTSTGVGDNPAIGYSALNQISSYAVPYTTTTPAFTGTQTTSYSYDHGDNPTNLGKITYTGTGTPPTGAPGQTQTYNAANQLCWSTTSSVSSPTCGGTKPSGSTTYTYNAHGDRTVTAGSSTTDYCYDQAERLVGAGASCTTNTYAYDGDGLRLSKKVGSVTNKYAWDDTESVPNLLMDGGEFYIYGPNGLPVERTNSAGTIYLHEDATGSVRLTTNGVGAITSSETYTPWGSVASHTGTVPSLGYDSQFTDPETGLLYLRARYYDPSTGQFLTRDPMVAMTRSAYGYGANDPLNQEDPSGLYWGEGMVHKAEHAAGAVVHAVAAPVVSATDGCILGHVHGDSGACRGTNVSHDLAVAGAVASVAAITISTGGLGDLAIAGVGLEAIGTGATAFAAGSSIAVAYGDCRADPGTAACFMDVAAAAMATVGGGLSIGGAQLAALGGEMAEFGGPIQMYGDLQFGVSSIGWGIGSLFADQLGGDGQKGC